MTAVQDTCFSKQTIQKWKTLASCHLGRSAVRKLPSLMIDIIAVDNGVKPAYLYDVGLPTAEKLFNFIESLKIEGLICNSLNVVQIGDDCLVVNVEEVTRLCSKEFSSVCLINVSSCLKSGPIIHNSPDDAQPILATANLIRNNCLYESVGRFNVPHNELSCNVTSLFGFLLNYPLIYWYKEEDVNDGNCLAMEKLVVVKVYISYTAEVNANPSNHVGNSPTQKFEHCLFSFSYPACLSYIADNKVSIWFDKLKQIVSHSKMFMNARLVSEEKVLDAVSL